MMPQRSMFGKQAPMESFIASIDVLQTVLRKKPNVIPARPKTDKLLKGTTEDKLYIFRTCSKKKLIFIYLHGGVPLISRFWDQNKNLKPHLTFWNFWVSYCVNSCKLNKRRVIFKMLICTYLALSILGHTTSMNIESTDVFKLYSFVLLEKLNFLSHLNCIIGCSNVACL